MQVITEKTVSPEKAKSVKELAEILSIPEDLIFKSLTILGMNTAYRIWSIPKKSGGERHIQAACWPLTEIQPRIAAIIYRFSVSEINHGFIGGRSHRTAILPHQRARAFAAFDIKNAFPSTKRQQIKKGFLEIGFEEKCADLMAELSCYSPPETPEDSFLPQGYASSPTLFNMVLKPIDEVLLDFARERDYQISRYVDNIAISSKEEAIPKEDREQVVKIVECLSDGFYKIPDEKTSYQEVENGEVHFEFLGLVIEGLSDGKRTIEVSSEKLAEYHENMIDALTSKDFSKERQREIRGQLAYLKSIYRKRAIPLGLTETYARYKTMAEITKKKQLFFAIYPFQ